MLGIVANQAGAAWELLQIAFNQFNREDVEGAGLDNLGDLVGVPREDASFTQVYCTLVFGSATAAGTYAAGAFVANVVGNAALTFANVAPVTLVAGAQTKTGILMQAQTIGATQPISIGTLTVITTAVTGWTSITNPALQSQLGTNAELDSAYGPRQEQDLAAEGSCSGAATAAALNELGASQEPAPIPITATVIMNSGFTTTTIQGISMLPHTYAPIVYDGGTGWAVANPALIAAVVYAEQPAGITSVGSTSATVQDPILGAQTVSWTLPTGVPLFVSATVTPRPGNNVDWTALVSAMQTALIQAAIAPTPADGVPPPAQLVPGSSAVGSQLEAILMAVPGVFDVQALTFGIAPSPGSSTPVSVPASQVLTILQANLANLVFTQGSYP